METRLRIVIAAARDSNVSQLDSAMITALESDFAEAARTLREMLRSEVV
jgi:hypothetical protein